MKNGTLTLTEALQYVGAIQNQGNAVQSLPQLGNRRIKTATRYIAGNAADLAANASSTILASTKKETGITNFQNGNLMPSKTNFLVTELRILFDTTTANPKAAVWANTAPNSFLNGDINVGVGNNPTTFESSISDATNFKASTGNDDDFRAVTPFLLLADNTFDIKLLTSGVALPATCCYKVEVRGIEIFQP